MQTQKLQVNDAIKSHGCLIASVVGGTLYVITFVLLQITIGVQRIAEALLGLLIALPFFPLGFLGIVSLITRVPVYKFPFDWFWVLPVGWALYWALGMGILWSWLKKAPWVTVSLIVILVLLLAINLVGCGHVQLAPGGTGY